MASRWTRELLDLLADCEVTPFKSSGPGGQKKNKTESSVRIRHLPTGIVRIGTDSRSQSANKLHALERLLEELKRRSRKPPRRIPTRRTTGSIERRISEKRRTGSVKRTRSGRISPDD